MTVQYALPESWVRYDRLALISELTEAKAAILSLSAIPYQRAWADALQEIELKREVAGTSRIEGAEFTDRELDEAISPGAAEEQLTRSQRQARSAVVTYRWIASLPSDRPIDENLVREVHARIVSGCDEDHCPPGTLRGSGQNVVFGRPRHRGVEGGRECKAAFSRLCAAWQTEFRGHDPLIQALAFHYHLGAMHPFHDGNGRTARAMEALILKRGQLKDTLFIAMSNYYYDEKDAYLACLADAGQKRHDLTEFLRFALRGIAIQCKRLLREIRRHVEKSLFRDVMSRLYGRLQSTRKRALAKRQLEILQYLLDQDAPVELSQLLKVTDRDYRTLRVPVKAFIRDMVHLRELGAIRVTREGEKGVQLVAVRLEWPTEITETTFYAEINKLPPAKTKLLVGG